MDVGLVCDACSALTPIGVPQCTRCGAAVALDPRPKLASRPPPLDGTPNPCTKCGTMVMPGQRFCPNCGNRIAAPPTFDVETRVGPRPPVGHLPVAAQDDGRDRKEGKPGRSTLFFVGVMQTARAKLTLIRGDGDDGVSF